jgi:hypothetical protein
MRSKLWNVGVLGAALVFVLLIAGCEQEVDEDEPSIPPAVGLGETLSVEDKLVYLLPNFLLMTTTNASIYAEVGNGALADAGAISSGKLSFSMPAVGTEFLTSWIRTGTSISPSTVKVGVLFPCIDSDPATGNDNITVSHILSQYDFFVAESTATAFTYKIFEYWYADDDAQITGTNIGSNYTITYSLALKQGWNSVMWNTTEHYSSSGVFLKITFSVTAGAVSADADWFAEEYEYSSENIRASRMSLQQSLLRPAFAPSFSR